VTTADGMLGDCTALVRLLEANTDLFTDAVAWPEVLDGLRSRHGVLHLAEAPEPVRTEVARLLAPAGLPGVPTATVLRRYRPGEYALPHRLREEVPGTGPGDWVRLFSLTGSAGDSVTYWAGNDFVRCFDRAGRAVPAPPDAWCWSSPVRGSTRYTAAFGGTRA
jgi:hypothetical protein